MPAWQESNEKPVLCCGSRKQCQYSVKHEGTMRLELLLMIENDGKMGYPIYTWVLSEICSTAWAELEGVVCVTTTLCSLCSCVCS